MTQSRPVQDEGILSRFEDEQPTLAAGARRALVWVPVFLAVFALLGLLAWGMFRQTEAHSSSSGTNDGPASVAILGRPAIDFTLPLYDSFNGQMDFSLSDYRGQVVVINFWASWCTACRAEAPTLERMWRKYRDEGVIFVGIDIWDTEQDARAHMREFDTTYPNVVDKRGRFAVEYGVTGIPETYFITPDGLISRKVIGAISQPILEQSIAEAWTASETAGK